MFGRLKSARIAQAVHLSALALVGSFLRQKRASSAVEFALVAAPLVALVFGILQSALIFLAGQSLETAAATSARLIMTGQAQTNGWTAAQFKQQVCNQIQAILDCANGVYVDVETYSSFAAVKLGLPISNGTLNSATLGYNPGGPGDVVVVRLYYQYPVFLSALNLSNVNGSADLLAATAVFQNEPYVSS